MLGYSSSLCAQLETGASAPNLYQVRCQGCHGAIGSSNEPFYPSLTAKARTMEPSEFVSVVLHGRLRGSIDLAQGGSNMPAHDYLPNEDIAQIVSGIYRSAGLSDTEVTTEQVSLVRADVISEEHDIVVSQAEYESAERLYFQYCAGCHGLQRQGLSGSSLDPASLTGLSSQSLMQSIHYGSPWGMPNWGTSEQLTAEQMSSLARYLKVGARQSPQFAFTDMTASWQQLVEPKQRPRRRQFAVATDDLFVSLLHDTGQVALVDGVGAAIAAFVDTDLAPHDIDLSGDGRYLYVLARGGQLAMIDLFMAKPQVVARARAAYTSRSLAVSRGRGPAVVAVGGHASPQIALFDAKTLEPLASVRLNEQEIWGQNSAIVDIAAMPGGHRFLILARGQSGVFDLAVSKRGRKSRLVFTPIAGDVRVGAGSFDVSGRHFLIPTAQGEVIVLDSRDSNTVTRITVPGFDGGTTRGVAFADPKLGALWALGSAASAEVALIGTDPKRHPDQAWKVLRKISLPSGGSLHLAAHQNAEDLWSDLTLSGRSSVASSVLAIDPSGATGTIRSFDLRETVPKTSGPLKAIQPQFSRSGEQIWFTLWNRQDQPAALVVFDAKSKQVKSVIADPRLITPIRTYSAATLLGDH
ncbi:MAG: cytochrome D1 domain-containing protein [Pseudomonadales bacterium]